MNPLELFFCDIWERGYMYYYNILMVYVLLALFYYREYIDKQAFLSTAIGFILCLFCLELINFNERIGKTVFDNCITLILISGCTLFLKGALRLFEAIIAFVEKLAGRITQNTDAPQDTERKKPRFKKRLYRINPRVPVNKWLIHHVSHRHS